MLLLFARRRSWATSTVTAAMIRGPAGGCSRPATSAQAIAFFTDLGLTVVGRDTVRGEWTETAVGLDGNHARVAMLQTPDGNGRLELFEYVEPAAIETEPTRPNEIGMHRVAFPSTTSTRPSRSRHGTAATRCAAWRRTRTSTG